jgi:hypothetical protein
VPWNSDGQSTIQSIQLISEISRLDLKLRIGNMLKGYNEISFFNDCKVIQNNIPAGATSYAAQLLFSGPCTHVIFVLQLTTNVGISDSMFQFFLPINNFTILDSKNQNLVHKNSSIDGKFFLTTLAKQIYDSTISVENTTSKNIYCYNFSNDIKQAVRYGSLCGAHQLTTMENLVITMPSTPAPCTLTTFIHYEQSIIQSLTSSNTLGINA